MSVWFSDIMVNLLLPYNDSFLEPNTTSTIFSLPSDAVCFFYGWSSIIFTTFRITYIVLLLPLSISILKQVSQKWRGNPSYFLSASMSHCDCFTYHFVIMQLIGVVGCIIFSCGVFIQNFSITETGAYIFFSKWYGEVLFHVLTCLERYVAVVHPITYLSLRSERGIRIRNVTVAFVWLITLGGLSLYRIENIIYWEQFFLILALVVIASCSIAVLWVLIRPRPGEQSEDRKKVDQSKQRVFFTIISTLGTLILRVAVNVAFEVVYCSTGLTDCVILTSVYWFQLPSSLALPIFYLYKERRSN